MRRLFSLADQFAVELQPGALLFDHPVFDPHIQNAPFLVDAMVENDVELSFGERRGDFVLDDLHLDVIADGVACGVLDGVLATDVDADAGVEFQRLAAGRGFRVAEHDADFFAQLIGENAGGLGLAQNGSQLAQRLAHQPGLHAHRGHAHLAFEFGLGHEGGNRIDHDHVEGVRAGERFADRQRLLAAVGLRDQQVVEIDAELLCVGRIERMFGVDKRRQASRLLRVGDEVQHQGRLAAGFRSENLDHPTARHAPDAQRQVERERAGGDHVDFDLRAGISQPHDASVAVGFGDAGNGRVEIALARWGNPGGLGRLRFDGRLFKCLRGHKFLLQSGFALLITNVSGKVNYGLCPFVPSGASQCNRRHVRIAHHARHGAPVVLLIPLLTASFSTVSNNASGPPRFPGNET